MKNEIEVIDGVKGEWRTVTKPSEVNVGQRVRYDGCKIGFSGKPRIIQTTEGFGIACGVGTSNNTCTDLFDGFFPKVQAFFPLPVRKSRKVAKVTVYTDGDWWMSYIKLSNIPSVHSTSYQSRKNAIRGAKRFCKAIGYECEIVK